MLELADSKVQVRQEFRRAPANGESTARLFKERAGLGGAHGFVQRPRFPIGEMPLDEGRQTLRISTCGVNSCDGVSRHPLSMTHRQYHPNPAGNRQGTGSVLASPRQHRIRPGTQERLFRVQTSLLGKPHGDLVDLFFFACRNLELFPLLFPLFTDRKSGEGSVPGLCFTGPVGRRIEIQISFPSSAAVIPEMESFENESLVEAGLRKRGGLTEGAVDGGECENEIERVASRAGLGEVGGGKIIQQPSVLRLQRARFFQVLDGLNGLAQRETGDASLSQKFGVPFLYLSLARMTDRAASGWHRREASFDRLRIHACKGLSRQASGNPDGNADEQRKKDNAQQDLTAGWHFEMEGRSSARKNYRERHCAPLLC